MCCFNKSVKFWCYNYWSMWVHYNIVLNFFCVVPTVDFKHLLFIVKFHQITVSGNLLVRLLIIIGWGKGDKKFKSVNKGATAMQETMCTTDNLTKWCYPIPHLYVCGCGEAVEDCRCLCTMSTCVCLCIQDVPVCIQDVHLYPWEYLYVWFQDVYLYKSMCTPVCIPKIYLCVCPSVP